MARLPAFVSSYWARHCAVRQSLLKKDWNMIKRWLLCLGLIVTSLPTLGAEVEWFTDVHAALDKARLENKIVLLDFTGSDWCGWCQRLKSEVFDQPEFVAFAQVNLVMVEVDFPHNKPQSPEQKAANQQLAATYHISGFPTLIYLNKSGQQVAIVGAISRAAPETSFPKWKEFPASNTSMAPVWPEKDQEPDAPPRPPRPHLRAHCSNYAHPLCRTRLERDLRLPRPAHGVD